jgi:hydroxymethylbilane synthase
VARRVRIATRGSPLALWQSGHVAALLRAADETIEVEIVEVQTTGDRIADAPIWTLGGKGVFVKEVQIAVLEGRADLAVHSAKDLPSVTPDGLRIAAVPERGDPRDALVGAARADLPPGGLVATGSARRRAQLAWLRPDLTFTELRGNVHTRLAKADDVSAVVMAAVSLQRLGLADRITEVLEPDVLLPQVGQGALAIEAGDHDEGWLADALAVVDHDPSHTRLRAERGFLAELGGDCDLPAGAYATVDGGTLAVEGMVASLDGHIVLRHRVEAERGEEPTSIGRAVARHLLDDAGGAALIA